MVPPRSPQPSGGPLTQAGYRKLVQIRTRTDGSDVEDRCREILACLCEATDAVGAAAYADEPLGLQRMAGIGPEAPDRLDRTAPAGAPSAAIAAVPGGPYAEDLTTQSHPILCADGPGGQLFLAVRPGSPPLSAEQEMLLTATACRLGVMIERRRRFLAEQRRHKEAQRLHEAQMLQAMGSMVRGVAHDLNNLLTVVLGQIQLASEAAPEVPAVQAATNRALDAVSVATAIADQLLQIARERASEPKTTDWNRVIRRMDRLLATMIGRRRALRLDLDESIGPVRADPALLAQIVLNLVLNARDALPDQGSVTLRTLEREPTGDRTEPHVILQVSDDGIGMDDAVRTRIFEPLFTTKPRGEGTGLGLPTVLRIVEGCGGRVRVDSAPGHGTTFEIELPRATDDA